MNDSHDRAAPSHPAGLHAHNLPRWAALALLGLVLALVLSGLPLSAPVTVVGCQVYPQNVILMIGDGMGFEQVRAAGMYLHGQEGTLSFEQMPFQAEVTTGSANGSVTDSAAAASAMATGYKVDNGVISLARPGDGRELETALEFYKAMGKSVGLVTTTSLTHATPAAFGAHEKSRYNEAQIAADYLGQTRPHVLFGGGSDGMSELSAAAAGYTVVVDRAEMQALDPDQAAMVFGQFGTLHLPYEYDGAYTDLPHLTEMTGTALDILDGDPDGFFLMVEGGRIDHAGHENNIERNVGETAQFAETVQVVLDWATERSDTLIVVTADHETGGLTAVQSNGTGVSPTVTWTTTSHTGVNVPVYALGFNADLISDVMDNTDLYAVSTSTVDVPCPTPAVPSDLAATAAIVSQINLAWTDLDSH